MRTEYWCEYYWAGTFRENHNMWFGIQDTTISYLIARNPWLKKQNSFQSTKELVESNWPVLYCCINSTTWNLESRGSSLSLSLSLSSTLSYHLYHLSLGEESAQLGHVIVIVLSCVCDCFVFVTVISSQSPGTWRGEFPAWPCLLGWVSLQVGAKVASSPRTPDNYDYCTNTDVVVIWHGTCFMWEVGDEWVAKTLSHKDTYDMSRSRAQGIFSQSDQEARLNNGQVRRNNVSTLQRQRQRQRQILKVYSPGTCRWRGILSELPALVHPSSLRGGATRSSPSPVHITWFLLVSFHPNWLSIIWGRWPPPPLAWWCAWPPCRRPFLCWSSTCSDSTSDWRAPVWWWVIKYCSWRLIICWRLIISCSWRLMIMSLIMVDHEAWRVLGWNM